MRNCARVRCGRRAPPSHDQEMTLTQNSIHRDDQDAVTILRIEHGKANTIDLELFEALEHRLDEFEAEGASPALVLTGSGKSFSAGVDLFRVLNDGAPYLERFLDRLARTVRRLFAWPRPVVVAVNGHAIAGGCVLAAAGDYRVMTRFEKALMGVTELKVGVPFPTAALEVMRYRVPQSLENLVMSGRLLSPEVALEIGLVEELADPEEVLDRAIATAHRLARIPAPAYALSKSHLRRPTLETIDRLAPEIDPQVLDLWSRPETLETIRSFLEATVGKK